MKPPLRSGAYWLFVVVGFAQLGVIAAIGDSTISPKAVVLLCALVIWLGFGSRVAWWFFVLANSFMLIATLALAFSSTGGHSSGTHTLWGDVIAICAGCPALLAILLSPRMRHQLRRTPSTA